MARAGFPAAELFESLANIIGTCVEREEDNTLCGAAVIQTADGPHCKNGHSRCEYTMSMPLDAADWKKPTPPKLVVTAVYGGGGPAHQAAIPAGSGGTGNVYLNAPTERLVQELERRDFVCVAVGKPASAASHAVRAMQKELTQAMDNWPSFNSAHEGYAVLLEEVEELWAHVKTNQKRRNIDGMRKEAIQVAAMAIRFAADVCNEERGRK